MEALDGDSYHGPRFRDGAFLPDDERLHRLMIACWLGLASDALVCCPEGTGDVSECHSGYTDIDAMGSKAGGWVCSPAGNVECQPR